MLAFSPKFPNFLLMKLRRRSLLLPLLGLATLLGGTQAKAGVRLAIGTPWLGWNDPYCWDTGFRSSLYWGYDWHHRHHHWDDWGWGLALSVPLVWQSDRWDEAARPVATADAAPPPSQAPNPSREAAPNGSEAQTLVLRGLAALASDNPVDAVTDLREAFRLAPYEAAALARSYSVREEAEFLKQRILSRYPVELSAGDVQFLKAVLFLYTDDTNAARGAVESIWDGLESTVALRRSLGH